MRPRPVVVGQVPRQDASQADFIQDDYMIETLASNGADDAFRARVGVSSRLHRQQAVRHKPSVSPIPSIRCVAGRFG
jgi:hypothetical protein